MRKVATFQLLFFCQNRWRKGPCPLSPTKKAPQRHKKTWRISLQSHWPHNLNFRLYFFGILQESLDISGFLGKCWCNSSTWAVFVAPLSNCFSVRIQSEPCKKAALKPFETIRGTADSIFIPDKKSTWTQPVPVPVSSTVTTSISNLPLNGFQLRNSFECIQGWPCLGLVIVGNYRWFASKNFTYLITCTVHVFVWYIRFLRCWFYPRSRTCAEERCESYVLLILQVARPVPRHPSIMFKLMPIHLRTCLAFLFLVHLIQTSAAMQTQRWCQVQRLWVVGFMMSWELTFQEFQVPWLKGHEKSTKTSTVDKSLQLHWHWIFIHIHVKIYCWNCWKSEALLGVIVMFVPFYLFFIQ